MVKLSDLLIFVDYGFLHPHLISKLSCSCFVDEKLSYDHLALGLKRALESDKCAFDANRLQKYTGDRFCSISVT